MHIDQSEFDLMWFDSIPVQKRKKGNNATSQKYYYKDIITAFDIETTYIKEIDNSVMYIWQWQFGDKCTVIGRTWHELKLFIEKLEGVLQDQRLMIFVHNLSFEFQFLSGVFDFAPDDVFAIDYRKVLRAMLHDKFEFRCSYIQTNMSLRAFCEKMGVKNYKLKMNYKKRRFWYTPLSQKEIAYCINDVKGLVQALTKEMERDGDNLYTLPLTSTGYARRDAKKAMRYVGNNYVQSQVPDLDTYHLLREAFRGGNTHASRYYSNEWLRNINFKEEFHSVDIASCYPDEIYNGLFPVTRFKIVKDCTKAKLDELLYKRHRAVLLRVTMIDVKLKKDYIPVPYIPVSKCRGISGGLYDNGRILKADLILSFTCTDVDWEIIKQQYDFEYEILTVAHARYGKLPESFRKCVLSYYTGKTELKGKDGDEEHDEEFYTLLYNKMKNLLNAQYGMMAQCPVKYDIKYINSRDGLFSEDMTADEEELLKKYYKRAFLVYQWGVWVTANARKHLQTGIDACGVGFIYCDTDSCKYVGSVDWDKVNAPYKKRSMQSGAVAVDTKGKKHYMGIFEREPDMLEFKTMGAKKYAYRSINGNLHITIAGVNKHIGAIELERSGGIAAMKEGFVFKYAGGLEARYSDYPDIGEYITEDGIPIRITRNVSLVENTKTLGLTNEYRELLSTCRRSTIDL